MSRYFLFSLTLLFASSLLGKSLDTDASILNDIADAILAQSSLPESYEASLLEQLDSSEESTIWRNYILQKLDVLYLHPDVDAQMRPAILARLWKESRSPTPTFAGTSLMTLIASA